MIFIFVFRIRLTVLGFGKLRLPVRTTRVYTQTGLLRIYARIYTNFTYKMRMRIYAIFENVRIAHIYFYFFE